VTFFHFTGGNGPTNVPAITWAIGFYGQYGIEVFFVISGFILPYSLWCSGYRLSAPDFRRFVWKRIVRLDPPYFATIALIILLQYLTVHAPGYRGQPFEISATQLALHVGYLNAFFNQPWLNPVFWTLAIECQFYLILALIFPLLASHDTWVRRLVMLLLACCGLLHPATRSIISFLPAFACGIAAFQYFTGIATKWEAGLIVVIGAAVLYLRMGVPEAVATVATALIIVTVPAWTNAPLSYFGAISYSLYLLHLPVGGRVMNLAARLPYSTATGLASLAGAFAVTIVASHLLYRFVEKPCMRYAASLRFVRAAEPVRVAP
jgi:peptidoglycan/LPS O-acetylase OafA/YrhL